MSEESQEYVREIAAGRVETDIAPTVSVVIPTVGRETLRAAVESALHQTQPPIEIWVCADTTDVLELPVDDRVNVLRVGPGAGGNSARAEGIAAASGDLIALLDDDDYWEATKLEKQLAAIKTLGAGEPWIASCRATIYSSGIARDVWPKNTIADRSVPDYLFKKVGFTESHNFLQASTLVFPRWMAIECPFDRSAKFHQDIGWLLKVSNMYPGISVVQVWEPLVSYFEQAGSVSRKITTDMSMRWAVENILPVSRRLYGDFLLTQTMFMARAQLRVLDSIRVFYHAISGGRPGLPAVAHALSVIIRMPIFVLRAQRRAE